MIGGLIEKSRLRLRLRGEDGILALRAHFARRGRVDIGVDNVVGRRFWCVTVPTRSTTRLSERSPARFDSHTRGG